MSREKESGTIVVDSQPAAATNATTWYVLVPSLSATYPQLAVWQVPNGPVPDQQDDAWEFLRSQAGLHIQLPDALVNHVPEEMADSAAGVPARHEDEPAALSLLQGELTRLRTLSRANVCLDALSPGRPPTLLSYPAHNDSGSLPTTQCLLRVLDTGQVHTGQAAFIEQQMDWALEQAGGERPLSSAAQWQMFIRALRAGGAGDLEFVYADPHSNIITVRGRPGLHQQLDRLLAHPSPGTDKTP